MKCQRCNGTGDDGLFASSRCHECGGTGEAEKDASPSQDEIYRLAVRVLLDAGVCKTEIEAALKLEAAMGRMLAPIEDDAQGQPAPTPGHHYTDTSGNVWAWGFEAVTGHRCWSLAGLVCHLSEPDPAGWMNREGERHAKELKATGPDVRKVDEPLAREKDAEPGDVRGDSAGRTFIFDGKRWAYTDKHGRVWRWANFLGMWVCGPRQVRGDEEDPKRAMDEARWTEKGPAPMSNADFTREFCRRLGSFEVKPGWFGLCERTLREMGWAEEGGWWHPPKGDA